MGAALAVFGSSRASSSSSGRRQVLELSAAKSSLGHAEPAAGAAGMLRAIFRWGARGICLGLPAHACMHLPHCCKQMWLTNISAGCTAAGRWGCCT